jgi:hypothetical protein
LIKWSYELGPSATLGSIQSVAFGISGNYIVAVFDTIPLRFVTMESDDPTNSPTSFKDSSSRFSAVNTGSGLIMDSTGNVYVTGQGASSSWIVFKVSHTS